MTTQQHDLGYRALFAHPEMVRELITGFTPFKLLDGVALAAFERVNADYVSERPSARHGDVVWRVRVGDHVLDVVILLEFQSGVDRCMALRMQTYVGLLCQDLVKRHQLSPGLLLPPVLPLVFYNGVPTWSAPKELAGLLMAPPAELADLQPSQRYALIDQWRLDRAALDANDDLLALLFRIELSRFPDVLKTHVPVLKTWFRTTPLTSLRTSVWAWWKALLERKTHNTQLFNLDSAEEGDMDVDLATLTWDEQMEIMAEQRAQIMAEQRALVQIEKATQEATARAMAEGTAQGRAQGKAEGKAEELITFRGILKNILRIKFGEVPPLVLQRIDQSAQADLERWIERSVTAPTLAALFGDDAAPVQAGRT